MNATDIAPDVTVRSIPLDKLELSPANVRKTDAGLQASAELKANIAALGILSNLVVRPVETNPGRFAVVAGGRRYAALVDLASEGQVAPDMPVPCRIVPTDASQTEISLAENAVRAAMHPADQVEAFALLAADGATVSDIAARFGVAERTVEQRLRLGDAAPELIEAYRAGEIDLETLKAFTVTVDPARQLAAWSQVSQQGYRPSAWQIRRMLTEDRVPAATAIARFVGVEAYEAAGGQVDRDLFADEHDNGIWFADPALLEKLAAESLAEAAAAIGPEWKWAEPRVEVPWNEFARFGRVHPVPAQPTDEETAETDRLRTRHDELGNMDEDDWTGDLEDEAETIENRLAEIEAAIAARAVFAREDKAIAGCILTVGHDGSLQTVQGLVRPDDIPSGGRGDGARGTGGHASPDTGEHATAGRLDPPTTHLPAARPDPHAEARKRAGVGIGLADDMRAIRNALVKAHLADDFEAAFDLTVFQLCRAVFSPGYFDHALDIAIRETPDRPNLRMNDDDFAAESPGEAMLADRSHLPLDWLTAEDPGESFTLLRALPAEDRQRLFAAAVARTLKGQLAFEHDARPEVEATVARLGIAFETHLRPSADLYWSRIAKPRIVETAREVLGIEWASAHSKDKKAVLAAAMQKAFAAGGDMPVGITAEMRAAAHAWTPPGFRAFDAAGIDDETEGNDAAPGEPDAASEAAHAGADPENSAETRPGEAPAADAGTDPDRAPNDAADAAAGANAVPTADGGPRVIVQTAGFSKPDVADTPSTDEDPVPADDPAEAPPLPAAIQANGHDGSADAFDIPEFLRR